MIYISPDLKFSCFNLLSSVQVGGRVKQKIAMEPPVEGIIRGSIVENIDGAVMNTHHESKTDSKIVRGSSGQAPIKPLVSVSWRVPTKNTDKKPGFHSDYSMPRMRTPSHN